MCVLFLLNTENVVLAKKGNAMSLLKKHQTDKHDCMRRRKYDLKKKKKSFQKSVKTECWWLGMLEHREELKTNGSLASEG